MKNNMATEAAVRLRGERMEWLKPATAAHLILAQYHAAYMDLQASLLGLSNEQIEQVPAEGEWPIRRVLAHILRAEMGFYVAIRYGLDKARSGEPQPAEITREEFTFISGIDEVSLRAILDGPAEGIINYHAKVHDTILREFAGIRDNEMEVLSRYWEKEMMPIRFRLHRFDAHMRQHIVQIDKTRALIGMAPNEAQRLLRLIYNAEAEVDGAVIGVLEIREGSRNELAREISARTEEIAAKLAQA
ncbi:MAG: DinB family protein [Anaerolineaceae bacterium]|nr:DinB family protein [Anaerolineaceae bacterium]